MVRSDRSALREEFIWAVLLSTRQRRHEGWNKRDESSEQAHVEISHGALQSSMPTYVYQVVTEKGDGEIFEVVQKMSEDPLTKHPETGEPVKRIIQPPYIPGTHSDHVSNQKLSNKNLDRLGFTKYERAGDGHYEKKAGGGPNVISAD